MMNHHYQINCSKKVAVFSSDTPNTSQHRHRITQCDDEMIA